MKIKFVSIISDCFGFLFVNNEQLRTWSWKYYYFPPRAVVVFLCDKSSSGVGVKYTLAGLRHTVDNTVQ